MNIHESLSEWFSKRNVRKYINFAQYCTVKVVTVHRKSCTSRDVDVLDPPKPLSQSGQPSRLLPGGLCIGSITASFGTLSFERHFLISSLGIVRAIFRSTKNSVALSPRANYTD
jgi:hypothetical protein